MLRKLFLLFIASFYLHTSPLAAQGDFVKGYLVTLQNDTLQGLILDKEWAVNPSTIKFKSSTKAPQQTFHPKDIHSFYISKRDAFYFSKTVNLDVSPFQTGQLNWEKKPDFEKQQVFLLLLVRGKANLYFIRDKTSKRHFFLEKGDILEELIFFKYRSGGIGIKELKKYIGQLIHHLGDCAKLHHPISKARFGKKDFSKIFTMYNQCGSNIASNEIYERPIPKVKIKWGALAGISSTKIKFSGHNRSFTEKFDFKPHINFVGGVFLNFILPKFDGRIAVHNELSLKSYKGKDSFVRIREQNQISNFDGELNLAHVKIFNFLAYQPEKKLPLSIKIGFSNGIAVKKKNNVHIVTTFFQDTHIRDQPAIIHFQNHQIGFAGGLNYAFGRFWVEGRFEIDNGVTGEIGLGSEGKSFFLLMGYHF